MTATLDAIFRHPVKSLGEEALEEATLTKGKPLPWDRRWAIAHGGAGQIDAWAPARNFVTQRHVPKLAQLGIRFSERNGLLHLTHPERPDLAFQPGTPDGDDALAEWLEPLAEGTVQSPPFLVYSLPNGAFTDVEEAEISLASVDSLRALEALAGAPLETIRFRMNLWIQGLEPWSELDLVGREIRIGEARLKIVDRDARCAATKANPKTGAFDIDVPEVLYKAFGHMDFGVYAQVVAGGTVRRGDVVEVL